MCCDYSRYSDFRNHVFYLDPPYKDRTPQFKNSFNHDKFWDFARQLSQKNLVFITEFQVPNDFKQIFNFGDTVTRHYSSKGKDGTTEAIWTII